MLPIFVHVASSQGAGSSAAPLCLQPQLERLPKFDAVAFAQVPNIVVEPAIYSS